MAYNIVNPVRIITDGDMSGNITSPPVETKLQDNVGFQMNWTGDPAGTFTIQVSMDHAQDSMGNVTVAGNWITLTLSASITASGSADQAYVDLNQISAPWARVVYTASSGDGVLNVFTTAKGV